MEGSEKAHKRVQSLVTSRGDFLQQTVTNFHKLVLLACGRLFFPMFFSSFQ